MNLVTLRVEGADQALDGLVRILRLEVDARWKGGDPKRTGGHHASSGLNATIADAPNSEQMRHGIRTFLADCKARNVSFLDLGLSGEVAVGISVGDSEQYVGSLELAASDLHALGFLGLALSVAAYPTSDEANATEEAA